MTSNHRKYLLLLILIFTASTAFGQKLDTLSFVNCNISYIADFNEDTYLDTLVSINYNHCNYPYYILWANPNNLASIKPKSVIKYPEYYSFKVTSNCVDMNTDNASDLIFTVRYKVKVDSVTYLDSAYNVILFG